MRVDSVFNLIVGGIWYIPCKSGIAYQAQNIYERHHQHCSHSITVWVSIMVKGCTPFHMISSGNMHKDRYINEIMLHHVRLYRDGFRWYIPFYGRQHGVYHIAAVKGLSWQQGYAESHLAISFPGFKSDSKYLGYFRVILATEKRPSTNKDTLIRIIKEEWKTLPQQLLDYIINSMRRHVDSCIGHHDGHNPY